jgi:hypothetical protein
MSKINKRLYVGIMMANGAYHVFRSAKTPTDESHGWQFAAVIGPFKTRLGAEFMRKYGRGNPHIQEVRDAEKLAHRSIEIEHSPMAGYCVIKYEYDSMGKRDSGTDRGIFATYPRALKKALEIL